MKVMLPESWGLFSQFRSKATRSTTLLALASIASAVSTLAVTTVATRAAAKRTSLALALTEHAAGRSVGALLLDVGGGDDLGGEVKPFAEVVEALGGQGVVVVLPRELGLDIAAGGQRLASLNDKEVLGVDVGVLGKVVVLRGDEDALTEEVLFYNCQYIVVIRLSRLFVVIPRESSCDQPWESTSWRFVLASVDVAECQFFVTASKASKWITFVGESPTTNST